MAIIKKFKNEKGLSIVEILIIAAIIGIALTSLLGIATFSLRIATLEREVTQANILAQKTMEAVRNFRDETDWNNDDPQDQYDGLGVLTTGVAYYPEKSSDIPPKWMLVQREETIDGFTQKVVFENVSRDTNDDIEQVYNRNNDDPDTKKTTVTVSWKDKKVEIVTCFTNWK